jgi:glycosyltransferase involved in cell wall biosynthesis
MVTYNHEKYIADAIESVLMQKTDFNYELVIGEDCSTDRTREIINRYQIKYPSKVKPIFHSINVGAIRNAMEFTFPICKGKYIACLEGDDFWTDPYKISKQVNFLDKNDDYSLCFHNVKSINENRNKTNNLVSYKKIKTITTNELIGKNIIPSCSIMFRNVYNGKLPSWLLYLDMGDWPLNIWNSLHGKVIYLPDVMAVYRLHDNSGWSSKLNSLNGKINSTRSKLKMLQTIVQHIDIEYINLLCKQINQFNTVLQIYNKIEDGKIIDLYLLSRLFINVLKGRSEFRSCLKLMIKQHRRRSISKISY